MVATVNGKPLHTTAVVRYMVRIGNNVRVKQCHSINFIVADVVNYNVILGMARL